MPSKKVPLVNGEFYHIYNRGVDKRNIFMDKRDYVRFYHCLKLFNSQEPLLSYRDYKQCFDDSSEKLVQIHAYALLPNHYHLIVEQLVDEGISTFMKKLSGGYTSFINERHRRSGALFQGKFKRIHIDSDNYFKYVFAYVNENHTVHKSEHGEDIFYTSSMHYQNIKKSAILPENFEKYDYKNNKNLAIEIAQKREFIKTEP